MASILVGATALAYTGVKKAREKRAARRAHNDARFAELERDNATRIAQLQSNTCFCQQSDWTGEGCEVHGYVPPAAERDRLAREREREQERNEEYSSPIDVGNNNATEEEDERRKINEERRLRMKSGAFTNWRLRRKGKGNNRKKGDEGGYDGLSAVSSTSDGVIR